MAINQAILSELRRINSINNTNNTNNFNSEPNSTEKSRKSTAELIKILRCFFQWLGNCALRCLLDLLELILALSLAIH